jgi:site-specific DNA-methyltransferase (adenine-specific)
MIKLHHGDCLDVLRTLPDCSVDAVVTDPPYGLSFMGKKWDYDVPSQEIWAECLRVLKHGGHLLAFAGTRTQHRMAVRIEDAGFEIRDMIAWVYGSGFPKSHDVSKAIDKAAEAEREVVQTIPDRWAGKGQVFQRANQQEAELVNITAPATEAAKQWQGWGTALKPALEPITVARKPLIGTVAENVLQHGTGAINVDGGRVAFVSDADRRESTAKNQHADFGTQPMTNNNVYGDYSMIQPANYNPPGRWPANFIHDGSEEVVGLFPDTKSGFMRGGEKASKGLGMFGGGQSNADTYGDSGSAARFFYCAKASKRDRDEGNNHPTVKPTDLMRYLCRLVTPPNGTVLDPFMGSGSTGKAAALEGFSFIGIEREAEYVTIAQARINHVTND